MDYGLSVHARDRLKQRRISQEVLEKVLMSPDEILEEDKCKSIYQRKLKNGGKIYLYRIYINLCKEPPMVITAYKTTKLEKYEN